MVFTIEDEKFLLFLSFSSVAAVCRSSLIKYLRFEDIFLSKLSTFYYF